MIGVVKTINELAGMNKICSVSEYNGDFMGQPAFFKVSTVDGGKR